jgi:hypothetical protein
VAELRGKDHQLPQLGAIAEEDKPMCVMYYVTATGFLASLGIIAVVAYGFGFADGAHWFPPIPQDPPK